MCTLLLDIRMYILSETHFPSQIINVRESRPGHSVTLDQIQTLNVMTDPKYLSSLSGTLFHHIALPSTKNGTTVPKKLLSYFTWVDALQSHVGNHI